MHVRGQRRFAQSPSRSFSIPLRASSPYAGGVGSSQKPIISATGSPRNGASRGCMMIFFGVFGVAGLATLYFTCLYPLAMAVVSRGWEAADCLVLSSEVHASRGSDSDTYR